MNHLPRWMRIVGYVIHFLLAGLMVMAGVMKFLPNSEAEQTGFTVEQLHAIAVGEILTAVLLIVPRTSSLGVLLASGFFGGTICFHMNKQMDYTAQSAFLLLTWIGGYLRNPGLLASLKGCKQCSTETR